MRALRFARLTVAVAVLASSVSLTAFAAGTASASSPADPSGGSSSAHKPANGAAAAQPPSGTVVGKPAPAQATPQTALPTIATGGDPQPLDLVDVPALPETVGGFDPATSVEVPSLRTVDTTVFLNANSTQTVFAYNGPIHYKDALGLWQNVDQTLQPDVVSGGYQPKAVGVGLTLAGTAAGSPLARLSVDSGHSVGYRLDGAAPAGALVNGATAVYPNALPSTFLELVALANGVKETIVLKSRSAPTSFTFPLSLSGVSASLDASGDVVYADSNGVEWARTPHGSMSDSHIDSSSDDYARSDGVTYSLVPFGGGVALRVTLDTTWLNDPARVFPVRVDPTTVTKLSDSDDTYVQSGYTANNSTETEVKIGTPDSTPHTTYSYLHFGGINSTYTNYYVSSAELDLYETHSWSCSPHTFTVHPVTQAWSGSTITAATQPTFDPPLVTVPPSGTAYSSAKGDTCGGAGWDQPAITYQGSGVVQNWTHGTPNYGLTVRPGSATDVNYWKRFASYQADPTNHSSAPQIKFTYSSEGAKYEPVSWLTNPTNTANGKFRIKVTNWGHDAWPAGGAYQLGYHLYDTAGNLLGNGTPTAMPTTVNPRQTVTVDAVIGHRPPGSYIVRFDMYHQGVAYFSSLGVPWAPGVTMTVTNQAPAISTVNSPADLAGVPINRPTFSVTGADTDNYPSGGTLSYYFRICTGTDAEAGTCTNSGWITSSTWTAPANQLYYRKQYYWHAYIKDSGGAQRNPTWVWRFTPVVSDTSADAHFGADPYGISDGGVNVSTSSYTTSAIEAPVATIGPPLSVTRTYNSGDAKINAFGIGWSTLYGMSATVDATTGNVAVVHADGRKALYGKNPDGTFAASYGYYSTLAAVTGGGWTLTDKGANTYTFSAAGKLTNVKDASGKQLTLADDGAGHTTVTDVTSGRALVLTWTGAHVTSVATPTVAAAGGPLVWRYYYTGDNLTAVCDPRNNALGGSCTTYEYGGTGGRLSKITEPRGNSPVQLAYYTDGTVLSRTDGNGKTWRFAGADAVTNTATGAWVHNVTVTDPKNHVVQYTYDGQTGRLTSRIDAKNKTRSYGYDTTTGFLNKITDENGNAVTLTVDDRGNITSRSVPYGDVAGLVATSYYTYKVATSPTDPTDNKLLTYRDARSATATDNTYAVTYGYDPATGQVASVTTPPTPTFPSGTSSTWQYTTGAEAAVGSTGTQPAGLLKTETDPRGYTITYSYNSSGDLTRTVDREGLRTDYGYDELGRLATETVFPASNPGGVTTTYGYDLSGIVSRVDGPPVLNGRTNQTHQQRTVYAPDGNGIVRDVTVSDLRGFDPTRVTHFDYDNNDQLTLTRDAEGGTTTRTYDDAENIATVTDARGLLTQFDYDENDRLATVTAKNFVDDPINPGVARDVVLARYTYDNAGSTDTATDARSIVRDYTWTPDQRLQSITVKGFHNLDGTTRDVVTEWHRYDPAGNEIVTKLGGYLRTVNSTYDAGGWLTTQVVDPATINRTTTYVRDQAGNVVTQRLSDGVRTEETRYGYSPSGLVTSTTTENGATDLTTTIDRDSRGLVTAVTDPRGNAVTPADTTYRQQWLYDDLGRPTQHTYRATTDESASGNSPTRRLDYFGYDTFGDQTQYDSHGFGLGRYSSTYDRVGRLTGRTYPSYTPPGGTALTPTETFGHNAAGDLTSQVDRRGNTTTFDVDLRGRLVRRTDPKPDPSQANPVSRWTYDDNGNRAGAVDPTGVRTSYSYDDLNQVRTVSNGTAAPGPYTTTFDYDDLGNLKTRIKPHPNETAYADYNAASELIQIQDAAGNLWKYGRDVAGRVAKRTDPLGRYLTIGYDLAGRATSQQRYSPANALLRTENASYDAEGNLASYTPSASGPNVTTSATRTYTWDREDRPLSITEPTTTTHAVTTSFGYDTWGNRTRLTDGNGNPTWTTYNIWNQPETVTEPSTAAYPNLADRQWTTTYDAGGLPVRVDKPGGVSVARTFDTLGRLTAETGSGAPGSRTLGYDLAGRLTRAGHPSGTEAFGYDDRGLLTSSSGPAGTATLGYDEDGRLTSRADAVGTTAISYDPRDVPATITDPITATTQTLTYWGDGQLKTRQYGTSGATRSYTYDNKGRLATDTVTAPSTGTVTASTSYSYDADGNVQTQTIGPAGIAGAGTHSYGYDLDDRLTSWTGPAGTKTYGYDDAGNRTAAGSATYSYDARNRLVSDSVGDAYSYTARGTLARTQNGGPQYALTADAFDRITNDTGTTFAYDSLDRIATQGTTAYSYDGTDPEPAAVGTAKTVRDAGGELVSTNVGTGGSAVVSNRHDDPTAYLNPSTGAVNGSQSFDPFGVKSTVGSAWFGSFQGQQANPAGRVYMQSRWYDPGSGTFASRDRPAMSAPRTGGANRYAYTLANPVTLADPTGMWGCPPVVCPVLKAVESGAEAVGEGAAAVSGAVATGVVVVGGVVIWGVDAALFPTAAGDPSSCGGWDEVCTWGPDLDAVPHGHYQGTTGGEPSDPHHGAPKGHGGDTPRPQPPKPRYFIAGPPPPGGPGTFRPLDLDPLDGVLDLAAAPAPTPPAVTGAVATDTDTGTCGHGGTVARCAPKQSALTPSCNLGGDGVVQSCEPVTPKTKPAMGGGGGRGGSDVRTAVANCEEDPTPDASACDGSADVYVYRVHGGDSGPMGHSWTPENPMGMESPRNDLGLPKGNSGQMLSRARVLNMDGVTQRPALPLDGNDGGAAEWLFPDPASQLEIQWTIPLVPPW